MKNKAIVVVTIIMILALGVLSIWIVNQKFKSARLTIEPMGDRKGIFVGEQKSQYRRSDPTKWSPEIKKRVEEYEASVRAIDESWKELGLANSYFKSGRYGEAIQAYKKAYEVRSGDESFFGMELVKAYEKLQQYDEALALLDEIETKYYKSEYGIQKAQEIHTRLLAAKIKK